MSCSSADEIEPASPPPVVDEEPEVDKTEEPEESLEAEEEDEEEEEEKQEVVIEATIEDKLSPILEKLGNFEDSEKISEKPEEEEEEEEEADSKEVLVDSTDILSPILEKPSNFEDFESEESQNKANLPENSPTNQNLRQEDSGQEIHVAEEEIIHVASETMETTILADEIEQHMTIDKNDNKPAQNNNENETSPTVAVAEKKSGIRPPTAILRQMPAKPTPPTTTTATTPISRISRPSTTTNTPTPNKPTPSPRPQSKMGRERSDLQNSKSTSSKSIDNVGRFTPKVNAKFVNVQSKVGSITNHKPGGGNVEIFSEKKEYKAASKVGSLANANHVAGGGNVRIENRKLDFSYASPKIVSKTDYTPAKSDVKVVTEKLNWNAKSKVGSMDNANHKPTGGNVQILSQKLTWKAESKVGSKDNIKHRPGGGNVKIFDEKIRYVSRDSSRNHSTIDISSL